MITYIHTYKPAFGHDPVDDYRLELESISVLVKVLPQQNEAVTALPIGPKIVEEYLRREDAYARRCI